MSSYEIAMLATERNHSGSMSNLNKFPVKKVVGQTLICTCREHGLRVTSRLFLAQRAKNYSIKMMTTKALLEDDATTMFDFRMRNSIKLSLIVVGRAHGPRPNSRRTFLVKGIKS